jgi:transcriptional repressor NrdR
VENGLSIRRRRQCNQCKLRFTTYENVKEITLMVVKKDGRREPFQREKIFAGISKACQKRPISTEAIENIVDKIERKCRSKLEREISSKEIGNMVMEELEQLDPVAYVRFASVYKEFTDVNKFTQEIRKLSSKRKKKLFFKNP